MLCTGNLVLPVNIFISFLCFFIYNDCLSISDTGCQSGGLLKVQYFLILQVQNLQTSFSNKVSVSKPLSSWKWLHFEYVTTGSPDASRHLQFLTSLQNCNPLGKGDVGVTVRPMVSCQGPHISPRKVQNIPMVNCQGPHILSRKVQNKEYWNRMKNKTFISIHDKDKVIQVAFALLDNLSQAQTKLVRFTKTYWRAQC